MATKKIKTEKETPSVSSKGVKNATNEEVATKPLAKKVTEKATAKKAKATDEQKEETSPKATNGTTAEKPKQVKIKATKPTATKEATTEPVAATTEPTIKKAAKKSAPKKAANVATQPTTAPAASASTEAVSVRFQLKYSTHFGEAIYVSGNNPAFGEGDQGLLMQYLNEQYWFADVLLPAIDEKISYSYSVVNQDGSVKVESGSEKVINPSKLSAKEVVIFDLWEENANYIDIPAKQGASAVVFNVKAPSLSSNQALFIAGNVDELGNWKQEDLQVLSKTSDGNWSIAVDLSNASFPVSYKYGIYDEQEKKFVEFEAGEDRVFDGTEVAKQLVIVSDGYVNLP